MYPDVEPCASTNVNNTEHYRCHHDYSGSNGLLSVHIRIFLGCYICAIKKNQFWEPKPTTELFKFVLAGIKIQKDTKFLLHSLHQQKMLACIGKYITLKSKIFGNKCGQYQSKGNAAMKKPKCILSTVLDLAVIQVALEFMYAVFSRTNRFKKHIPSAVTSQPRTSGSIIELHGRKLIRIGILMK